MQLIQTITQDKLILHGCLYSGNSTTHKLILHIHGMSGSVYRNRFYQQMSRLYPKSGFDFLIVEHRGTGTITPFKSSGGETIIKGTKDYGVWIDQHRAMQQLEQQLINSPKVKAIVFDKADHSFNEFGKQISENMLKSLK